MVGIDTKALRQVLGCYATGIAVITTRSVEGRHVGITVNSFTSVSLNPPLVLFSLGRNANALRSFQWASEFAVNILAQQQKAVSDVFAKPSSACWDNVEFSVADNGCALIANSLAHLECSKKGELDGGDHVILLGEVSRYQVHSPADPLLFYRGAYGTYTEPL